MSLFSGVTNEEIRIVQAVTGAAMAAFLTVGLVPAFRQHATQIRLGVLVLYLLACGAFVVHLALR